MALAFRAASQTTNSSTVTSVDPGVPSGSAEDDILILCIDRAAASDAITWPSGFTELFNTSYSGGSLAAAWLRHPSASPTDLQSTWSTSSRVSAICYSVSGAVGTGTPVTAGTTATGSGTTPDPPSSDPGSSDDRLAVVVYGQEGKQAGARFTPPSGYTEPANSDTGHSGGGGPAGSCGIGMAYRTYTGQAENPGTATSAVSDDWAANTIVFDPAADTTESGTPVVQTLTTTITSTSGTVTAEYDGTPVVQTLSTTLPAVTATATVIETATVAPVSVATSITTTSGTTSTTATATVAALSVASSVVDPTATVTALYTATVAPLVASSTIVDPAATYESVQTGTPTTGGALRLETNIPATSGTTSTGQIGNVSPVVASLSVVGATATVTAVATATVAAEAVTTTIVEPAGSVQVAGTVAPVTATTTIVEPTASASTGGTETGTPVVQTVSLTIPSVTANAVKLRGRVSPVVLSLATPTITPTIPGGVPTTGDFNRAKAKQPTSIDWHRSEFTVKQRVPTSARLGQDGRQSSFPPAPRSD